MIARLPGWGDEDVLALLALFRKHLSHYIYASDKDFSHVVHAELPDKPTCEIQEMVKSLMRQFGLVLSTKNFRNEVIVMNGKEIFVHEHIYESISQLPENKAGGGAWLPDELSRFFQKAKQYRSILSTKQEVYFKRIQIWGKSVTDTINKFYVLRDMYMKEKRRPRERVGVHATRFKVLEELFHDVPPRPRIQKVETISKASKLWTPQDLNTIVDFVVRITQEIQATGSSELVNDVAQALNRTEQSCMNKLADMREKYLKKSTSIRAANLPDIIYDPTSVAHKIFNADWTDINDPYALGYLAFKSTCLRNLAVRKKRRNKTLDLGIRPGRPKRRPSSSSARETTVNNPMDHSVNNPQVSSAKPAVGVDDIMNLHNLNSPSNTDLDLVAGVRRNNSRAQQRAATLPTKAYAAFVRDIGEQCQWTDKVAHNVLRCMQHSIDLYRANKLVEFFRIVASLTPGVSFQELLVNAEYILTTFKQRFGTLDGFENLALTSPNASSTATTNAQAAEQKNGAFAATSENDPNDTDATIDLPSDSIEQQEADANTREQQDELSPESPGQLGTEDAIDEHSSSTAEKQSSPEDTWEIGNEEAAGYVGMDDDSQSTGSFDNAWSGSSNASDAKGGHDMKENASSEKQYPQTFALDSSKKPSKRGKDDHGKSFDLAKKRRLEEKSPSDGKDEDEDDEDEDEGYDDGDDEDDDQSDDADVESPAEVDSISSDGECDESLHPLQNILDSLDTHIVNLEKKRQELIERKKDREWRQQRWSHHHVHREYDFQVNVRSCASVTKRE